MNWFFDDSDLENSAKDQVRLLIGDTDESDKLISDPAITFRLSEAGQNVRLAAAACCEDIAAKFARKVDYKNGSLSVSASKRADAYRALAMELRRRDSELCEVFAGGLTRSGKDALEADSDAIQPRFSRGMNRHAEDSRGGTLPWRNDS